MSEENQQAAVEQVAAAISPSDDLEKYTLHGRRQIRQLLEELMAHHALIAAHFGNNQSFVTALIGLSDDEDSLFLDVSPDTRINRRVLANDRLLCVTQLDRIRIQFPLSEVQEVSRSGHNIFRAPVPERILRLQRREFFRLQAPIAHAPSCSLHAKGLDGTARQIDARVLDISVGGVALQLPPAVAEFVIGGKLDDCTLRLPELDPIPLHMEVRNINRNVQRSGTELLRLGCQFVGLSRSGESVIQRYIFNTERERNARERGAI